MTLCCLRTACASQASSWSDGMLAWERHEVTAAAGFVHVSSRQGRSLARTPAAAAAAACCHGEHPNVHPDRGVRATHIIHTHPQSGDVSLGNNMLIFSRFMLCYHFLFMFLHND